ncbi:Acetyltransferase (GNAT) family protein [Streptomyces sp. WMMB 714]|uniref:GNAT family N-acetyltransferase n=1 Tax=Streptomyces sp. WMMB 714 TaxID=1286822 RepID=UPI000696CEE6|nr:GNAT family N-acetyltransferase [Streptomyces sp. WMMB 714]SCK44669.1 Acetyltransferase (GNAT) family protein [Streptomyces sp. WMMB 714]
MRPEVVGTGVGRLLAGACLARAAASGAARILLWVIDGNARARRFYERAGFTRDTSGDAESLDGVAGTRVTVVRYARPLLKGAV